MTNNYRNKVKEKVPESLKTAEFKLLLHLIKENNLDSSSALQLFITTKIATLELELKDKRTSTTMTDERRKIAKEVDSLKSIKNQFFKFL